MSRTPVFYLRRVRALILIAATFSSALLAVRKTYPFGSFRGWPVTRKTLVSERPKRRRMTPIMALHA